MSEGSTRTDPGALTAPGSRAAGASIVRPVDRTSWRLALLLAVVIAAAYANSLGIGFRFDDWHVVEDNPHIRSLGHIGRFFVDPNTTSVLHENKDLRPLLMVSLALNYAVSGVAPWSYHVVNLLLHWLVALLVLRIVRDHFWLGRERIAVAAAAALVVAVHPLNTEPVDYISARSALLTAAFYLGAFDAFARARRARCLVLFALALLTKAIAVTLPLAVVGYWFLGRSRASAGERPSLPWVFLAALVGVAVAGVVYRLVLLPPWTIETARQQNITRWVYFMTEWSAYLYYLRLFLWPDALVIDRVDYAYARSLSDPRAWGSLLALLALGGLAWRARRRWPALTFAVWWYAVALAAESTIFPLAEPVNEHRPYLSMLGLGTAAGLASWGLASLGARKHERRVRVLAGLLLVLTATLGAATFARNRTWQDEYGLWRDAIEKAPENSRAWLNAGHAAIERGHLDEARRLLLEAHRIDPCYAYIQMNLSALEAREGDLAASFRWADEALRCQPDVALTHYYRARALERLGRRDEALAEYGQATSIDDQHADSWVGQGRLLEEQGTWAEAAAVYDRALTVNPADADAAMLAGLVYHHHLGQSARAVERYQTVLQLEPHHYGAHYQIALALLASGRTADARAAWREFVGLAAAIGDRESIDGAPEILQVAER